MRLLLATQNQGKLAEFKALLRETSYQLLSPAQVGLGADFDPEEVGDTFQEVAEHKAQAYAQATGLAVIADDSGLEVTALGGQPGVKSKRFVTGTDHDRNLEILRLLAEQSDRSSQFKTVLCLYDPVTQQTHFFEGEVKGHIALEERGQSGFGYDPIFIPEGYDHTFAELGSEVKNQFSHRANALAKLKAFSLTR